MFKYEYGQLPDRDIDFRLVGVHVWNYICDNIKIATSLSSLKKKNYILKICFYLI